MNYFKERSSVFSAPPEQPDCAGSISSHNILVPRTIRNSRWCQKKLVVSETGHSREARGSSLLHGRSEERGTRSQRTMIGRTLCVVRRPWTKVLSRQFRLTQMQWLAARSEKNFLAWFAHAQHRSRTRLGW